MPKIIPKHFVSPKSILILRVILPQGNGRACVIYKFLDNNSEPRGSEMYWTVPKNSTFPLEEIHPGFKYWMTAYWIDLKHSDEQWTKACWYWSRLEKILEAQIIKAKGFFEFDNAEEQKIEEKE